jgi:amidase
MSPDDLCFLDAHAQAELVRTGQVAARELVAACLARMDRVNPTINAVIHRFDERALEQAHRVDERRDAGSEPFAGVPFLLKDIVSASAGDPMHGGMRVLKEAGWTEPHDSWLTQRFRSAGLILCGHTNTPELATSITCEPIAYGASRNPWDLTRSTGGSSGGSAAAVAAGIVAIAHANDMGGSIRIPAANCGLVGLKPSRSRSTLGPDLGELWGPLTHEHVVTRTVRDTAAMLDTIAGPGIGDPYPAPHPLRAYSLEVGADPGRLRIGSRVRIPRTTELADPDCVAAVHRTLRVLESLGHHVDDDENLALDEDGSGTGAFFPAVVAAEVDRIGRRLGRVIAASELEPPNALLVEIGRKVTASDYLASLDAMYRWSRRVVAWWHGDDAHDLLVTPVAFEPAWPLGLLDPATNDPRDVIRGVGERVSFTNVWNDTGQPAIALPLHRTAGGLPVGVQIIAGPGREDLLLRVAAQLEAAMPWASFRPAI